MSSLSSISIPQNWQEVFADEKWKAAMVEEMHALKNNGTWDLIFLPPGKQLVGSKRVFVVKQKIPWTDIKHNWWQRDLLRLMGLTIKKPLL